ncbi:hypothetical protein [Corynebacterium terpenotabidum]|uniref:DUF2505 domain-containing protein n=1 Tax=Corynebacterium terpenotabidum Y-11 TaxID=1200352 RepID=S4XHT6_9CORY|nr:hypothetical protein [Corynebacterium terpenotabidum]AGP30193.1 hypothetical protein A606_02700 [Corynebacterium terpenotabidum Y-11]
MATKATTVLRDLDLPIGRIREVVVTEDFLLTVDDVDGTSVQLSDGVREVHDDGSVTASVTATTGEGKSAQAMVQHTEVSAVEEDGSFSVFTSVPLPKDLGTMATNQIYRADGDESRVQTTVAVEIHVPVVGAKIAARILDGAESSTDAGLARIRRLAAR